MSKTAVSFAFNSPDRLSPETATRIRAVAAELGYLPHPVARMLSERRTRAIGILTPQALSVAFANPFFSSFTEGFARATEASGYALDFISPLHGSLARAIGRAAVDGVVAVGFSSEHPEVAALERAGVPMILVDSAALPTLSSVDVDDVGGARLAAKHLLDLGHRAFLVLAVQPAQPVVGDDHWSVPNRRLAGYRAALEEGGIALADEDVVIGPASIDGGQAVFQRAWKERDRPTAVLAMSDAMAIGAMRAARDLDQRVPEDVSIVGFDDIDLASLIEPPLTTVHQPIRRKGEEAARLLLSLLDAEGSLPIEHRVLETRLIVRASTAAPRSDGR